MTRDGNSEAAHPLHGARHMPLDETALVGAHFRQLVRREPAQFRQLARQALGTAHDAVRIHELDAGPAVACLGLEQRSDLDRKTGLLLYLAPQRLLQALGPRDEAAEQAPARRAEGMPREEDAPVGVDADADDPDEEL